MVSDHSNEFFMIKLKSKIFFCFPAIALVLCFKFSLINAQNPCYSIMDYYKIAEQKDTFSVPYIVIENIDILCEEFGTPKLFYVNKVVVDSVTYHKADSLSNSAYTLLDKAARHYCKFYYEDGTLGQEGVITGEFYLIGYVKSYYKTGVLREEGAYSDNHCYIGKKIGTWKYYNELSKLIKEEVYDKEGKLLSVKKPKVQSKNGNKK